MSKELEALEVICGELVETDLLFIDRNGENQEKWRKSEAFAKLKEFDKKYGSPVTVLQNALQRLESIENANPSEALECLEKICVCARVTGLYKKEDEDVVKQALLKQQEPKQYLKWEDLEFDYNMKNVKVKMGDNEYIIRYFLNALDDYDCFLCDDEANQLIRLYKQFFNDLHLEVLE